MGTGHLVDAFHRHAGISLPVAARLRHRDHMLSMLAAVATSGVALYTRASPCDDARQYHARRTIMGAGICVITTPACGDANVAADRVDPVLFIASVGWSPYRLR